MFSPSEFRDLVSGRRRGLCAGLARVGLRCLETPYTAAVRWRNWRYDTGRAATHHPGVPVLCVGNLTLGGTGKTPLVRWIAQWLRDREVRVALVSRGYMSARGASNDEAMELAARLPGVPHIQNPDRVVAARRAVEQFGAQLILLDDGFQHRRLARELDIVLLDALEPLGFEHVFPRGTLREPLAGLRRADVVALSRADMLAPSDRQRVARRVEHLAPGAVWLEVIHAPRCFVRHDGRQESLDMLREHRVAAFCGLGNPAGFRHTLAQCGCQLAAFREFDDHHRYDQADVDALAVWADALDIDAVVCTHKDLVKLGTNQLGRHPLWAVAIDIAFLAGQAEFENRLAQFLP